MTIVHHATGTTLLRYAAGTLAAGPAIVVEAHLAACPVCRAHVAEYEALGGALLEQMEPMRLSPTALADVLGRIDAEDTVSPRLRQPAAAPMQIDGTPLPDALRGCEVGRWRWMGPGMRMSRIGVPHDRGAKLILLKIGPGMALPEHGHVGTELTYVVAGSFSDALGRFGPGDLADLDAEVEHQPVVDPDSECICLAAIEGRMRFNSVLGRMLQPLFGI